MVIKSNVYMSMYLHPDKALNRFTRVKVEN